MTVSIIQSNVPNKANPKHWQDLENVTTLAQAARDFHVARQTLSYLIDANNIIGIRVGKSVLISTRSLKAYFSSSRQ
jgi:hypothetical protein